MQNQLREVKNYANQHCPAKSVPSLLNPARKGRSTVASNKKASTQLNMSEEQRTRLKAVGVWLMELVLDEPAYSLTRTAQICDISPAWLRTCLKKGTIVGFKDKRNRWQVKQAVVASLWQKELEKHISRLDAKKEGKKYQYRRPTEWAYHLIAKYVKEPGKVTPSQRKTVLTVIEKAKIDWDVAYQERLVKKAAKLAEEAKKSEK